MGQASTGCEVVRKKLREYREVKSAFHPPAEDGGDGVTVVEF
jgi:dsDNA-specific endonuclease/ATPase MutS2